MKLSVLERELNLKLLTECDYEDREVNGGYVGDLLSWVMGRAQSGNVWITIMSNINIVAVATLTDCACILLSEGVVPDANVVEKANSQGIIIMSSELSSYELSTKIGELIKNA